MFKKTRKIILPLAALVAGFTVNSTLQAEEVPSSFESLIAVEDAQVASAYIDPNVDFDAFKRVMILDTFVSFRSGWERGQRRGTRGARLSASDIERIKNRVSELFNVVFIEALEADGGFEVVSDPDYDVLLIRAAIIDLDITAPDASSGGRSRTYIANSGAATLYIELFDSVSGQIIGRAFDRQSARSTGNMMTWSNRATNTADAQRVFRGWAGSLREFLDSHYSGE